MLTGGCYCGAIRYEATGPVRYQTNCHCTMCRGTTGAPCVAWFTVASACLTVLSGKPTQFRSSDHGTRAFCATCGTQLTFIDDASLEDTDVTTCSLDQPERAPPQSHIYTRSQMPWLVLGDALPRHAGSRTDG
jgi:hypothetical protein